MKSVSELKVQIFADGADKASMLELYRQPYIKGFTTNPTLMRKAGITDYERFAHEILESIPDRPISFEVFADDEAEMERQARKIARWAANVYVKIPVTNTRRQPMYNLVRRLSAEGIQINATAVLALCLGLALLLLAPWPGYGRLFRPLFCAFGNAVIVVVGAGGDSAPRFSTQPGAAPTMRDGSTTDWTVWLAASGGDGPSRPPLPLETKILGYTPLALSLALTLSFAVSWRRKLRMLGIGLAAAFCGSGIIGWLDPFSLLVRSTGMSGLPTVSSGVSAALSPLEHSRIGAVQTVGSTIHRALQGTVISFRQTHYRQGIALGLILAMLLALSQGTTITFIRLTHWSPLVAYSNPMDLPRQNIGRIIYFRRPIATNLAFPAITSTSEVRRSIWAIA